eukprot:403363614
MEDQKQIPTYRVHYFTGYGRGDCIRMLLTHAKVDWEDVYYTPEQFYEAKMSGKLEFKQLPLLEYQGKFYSQTQAILRLLGNQLGYYPQDPYEAYKVDSIMDFITDFMQARFKANNHPDPVQKKILLTVFCEVFLPKFFTYLQERLKSSAKIQTSQYFSHQYIAGGEKISIADFGLAGLAYSFFYNENHVQYSQFKEIVQQFPLLDSYFQALGEELKEYLDKRQKSTW